MKKKNAISFPDGDWGAQFRWSFADPACQEALVRQKSAMTKLKVIYDNDGLWDWGDPKDEGPEMLHRMVDQYADAGSNALVWGCGNNMAWSYTPAVQEAWCDRIPADNPHVRMVADRQREWLNAGTNPLAVILERAGIRNLSVLAGFRLNRFMPNFGVESWFENNPHVALSEASCPMYANTFSANLALPEVREHFVKGSMDVVKRYQVDGLHLEFMRAIPFFENDEPNKVDHMNTFLRMLRKELDRIGRIRGRKMKLSIWIGTPEIYRLIRKEIFPPEFFDPAFHGIEPETWITEKWVDMLIASVWAGQFSRGKKPVNISPWVHAARQSGAKVLGNIANSQVFANPGELAESVEIIRSVSSTSGGVFLFNTQPLHLALMLDVVEK